MSETGGGKKRKVGCIGCLGCLGVTAVVAVLAVAAVLMGPSLLRKIGIWGADAEELYSGAADPLGTALVTEILDTAGFEGVDAVVMPVKGSDGQIAIFTLDNSSRLGSPNSTATGEEQFMELIQDYTQANQSGSLNIETVALDYQGENGESLISLSVPQEAIDAFAAGEISRREFVRQVEIDFSNLISMAELRQLMTEMEATQ